MTKPLLQSRHDNPSGQNFFRVALFSVMIAEQPTTLLSPTTGKATPDNLSSQVAITQSHWKVRNPFYDFPCCRNGNLRLVWRSRFGLAGIRHRRLPLTVPFHAHGPNTARVSTGSIYTCWEAGRGGISSMTCGLTILVSRVQVLIPHSYTCNAWCIWLGLIFLFDTLFVVTFPSSLTIFFAQWQYFLPYKLSEGGRATSQSVSGHARAYCSLSILV